MRTYTIDDLQGGGFCSWSYDQPPTRAQIIAHFDTFRIDEGMDIPKKCLTLKNISNIWEVSINPTTQHEAKNEN
jgi:hypothetical protein